MRQKVSKPVVFFITSVIEYIDRPLSYIASRSTYNPKVRALQTLETVESIRSQCPEAKIILLEAGLNRHMGHELISKVDKYVYLGCNKLVRWAVDGSNKSLGETMMLLAAAGQLRAYKGHYFKISGRYLLNTSFDLDSMVKWGFCFKKYGRTISTRLYSFSRRAFPFWVVCLVCCLPLLLLKPKWSVELVMPLFVGKQKIKLVETLGVQGYHAPGADFCIE